MVQKTKYDMLVELLTDWENGGRLDLIIDAIKAVTDALPDAGALNDLTAILLDTGTTIPGTITTLQTAVTGIQNDLDNATDGLGALKALIDAVQADATAILLDTGTTIPGTITTLQTAVTGIQNDLDNATDGLGALKALIDAAQADITAILLDTGTTIPGTITTLQTAVTGIQNDLDNATDGLGALKALIDNLDADVVAVKAVIDDIHDTDLPAVKTDAETLLTRLSAARAGYLDELDFALQEAIAALQTDLDNPAQYKADLTTLETRLSAARAGYLDQLDFNLQEAIAAIPTTMVGTNNAALAANWTAALATALGNYTAVRAGYIDELAAANIPADIDELKTSKGRMLFSMDFWSLPQEEVAVTNVAGDKALPSVVVAEIPDGATIVRAIAMFKFRMVEAHTYAGVNKLNGAQEIQVKEAAAGAWTDAINFVDDMFTLAQDTREGGDVIIGAIDVSAVEVDANDTYSFQWDEAVADQDGIKFNDVQCGLRIWYSI